MFTQWPEWMEEDINHSPAYETWLRFGPLKIPLSHQKSMDKAIEDMVGHPQRKNYDLYFTEMDHTDGSVGGNFYEGQMACRVEKNLEKGRTPSVYLKPQRLGYGRFVYLTSLNEDVSIYENVNEDSVTLLRRCTILEGQWKQGKLHGFGRIIDEEGNCYIGEFADGLRDGQGRFIWKSGDIFDGYYSKGEIHGWGTFFYAASAEAYNGLWCQGEIHTKDSDFPYQILDPSGAPLPHRYHDFSKIHEYLTESRKAIYAKQK